MNLLPIPVVDGGQIILAIVLALKKNKIKAKSVYRYQVVGAVIVFLLIIIAVFSDIFFLIQF